MEPVFDSLTIIAIISVTCFILLMLVVLDCCKMRKYLRDLLFGK
jgi:hypothetical protein